MKSLLPPSILSAVVLLILFGVPVTSIPRRGSVPLFVRQSIPPPNADPYACVSGNWTFSPEAAQGGNATLAKVVKERFTSPPQANETVHNASTFRVNPEGNYTIDNAGDLVLRMFKGAGPLGLPSGIATTMSWSKRLHYGKVEARIKAGPGMVPGVVDAFITQSPEGDEIDYEWVGSNSSEVWTNWFWGGVQDYGRGGEHALPDGSDARTTFHTYGIEWTPANITWTVDGTALRTVNRQDYFRPGPPFNGTYLFPTRPSDISLGIWDGGAGPEGTREWAGGYVDWMSENAVQYGYNMTVRWIAVTCATE